MPSRLLLTDSAWVIAICSQLLSRSQHREDREAGATAWCCLLIALERRKDHEMLMKLPQLTPSGRTEWTLDSLLEVLSYMGAKGREVSKLQGETRHYQQFSPRNPPASGSKHDRRQD